MKKIYALITLMLMAVCPKTMAQEEGTTTEEKTVAWNVPAEYYSEALDSVFESKIEAYTDGSYAIKGVYGSDKDIEFTIDNESVIEGTPEIVLTNYYLEQPPYYYFAAGDYTICVYYQKGAGYTGWEGDTDEPGVWFYTYLYKGDNYISGGYDYVTWKKEDVTGIKTVSQEKQSDRVFSISGVEYTNKENMPAGLYIKNGKKFIVR